MTETLVLRFGSLGDLCLLGWAIAERRDRHTGADERVTLVTKPRFAGLMARMRGVDEVITPTDTGAADIARLARTLRARRFDEVLDAHNILRGHLLLALMGRRPRRRLGKDTAARLWFLRTGRNTGNLQRTMADRFRDLMLGPDRNLHPAPQAMLPPLPVPAPEATLDHDVLGLAPGAQWDTKRWPDGNFAALARAFLARNEASVRIFLGPREESWFDASTLAELAGEPRVTLVRGRSLEEVAAELAGCRLLVCNDSGLLHLAEAVGTPVLAFFGPTVRQFGYFPRLPASGVMERDLRCRPCSRNGKPPCHRHDLACLAEISPEAATDRLQTMWAALQPRNLHDQP